MSAQLFNRGYKSFNLYDIHMNRWVTNMGSAFHNNWTYTDSRSNAWNFMKEDILPLMGEDDEFLKVYEDESLEEALVRDTD